MAPADPALLLVGSAMNGAGSAMLGFVGARLARRELPARHRAAGRALALALLCGAAFMLVNAAVSLAVAGGATLGAMGLAAAWTTTALGLVLTGGLVAYLAHLLTGRPGAVRAVAVGYGLLALAMAALILSLGPTEAIANGWTIRFAFARAGIEVNGLLALVTLAPAALASLAYLALLPRAQGATTRWRIALVGGGLTAWLAAAVSARLLRDDGSLLVVVRAVGLCAALAILLAYSPPRWARERWSVRALSAELAPPPRDRAASQASFAQRVRDLV